MRNEAKIARYNYSFQCYGSNAKPTTRIHLNIITAKDQAINVIPSSAQLIVAVRALEEDEFQRVLAQAKKIGGAAAASTGTSFTEKWTDVGLSSLLNACPFD